MSYHQNRLKGMHGMATDALETPSKIRLLRKVIEIVMWEWNAVKEGRWEELPSYSAKKKELLTQMAEYNWTPVPAAMENPEILILESQIIDLQHQVHKMLENRMNVITAQLQCLERRNNNWRRAINPYKTTSIALAAAGY